MVTEVAREGSLEERFAKAARVMEAVIATAGASSGEAGRNKGTILEGTILEGAARAAEAVLSWGLRVNVLREVASALDYLHCNEVGCDQWTRNKRERGQADCGLLMMMMVVATHD
jgi:hypothetical protein